MIYRFSANIIGSGELPIKAPYGKCTGLAFELVSGAWSELVALKNTDNYILPLSPVGILNSTGVWKKNIIPVDFDTKTYLRLEFNTAAAVELNVYLFIDEPLKAKPFKYDVILIKDTEFNTPTVRLNNKGKITAVDLVNVDRVIDWQISDGYEKFLIKRTDPAIWTARKEPFTDLLFPVRIDSNIVDVTVDSVNAGDKFFLIYTYD